PRRRRPATTSERPLGTSGQVDDQVLRASGSTEPGRPEGATRAPEGATRAPEGATRAPEGATRAPEGATRAPEGATRAPEGATRAPEGAKRARGLPRALFAYPSRALGQQRALDLLDRLRHLDATRAGVGAVERRAAAPHALGVVEDVQPLLRGLVTRVEDEPVGVDDRGGAEVRPVRPVHRARRRARRA